MRRTPGSRLRYAVAAAVLAAGGLTACGTSPAPERAQHATRTTAPTGSTTPAGKPTPQSAQTSPKVPPCHTAGTALTLHGHHTRLEAVSLGSGPVAAVFLHESGMQGMCGFWPYAWWLTHHRDVRAILVNRCGYGVTSCHGLRGMSADEQIRVQTRPAVRWALRHGATTVVLVGASAGGGDALQAAGLLDGVDAVVDLSGDQTDTGADLLKVAHRVQVPAFVAVAHDDHWCPIALARKQYQAIQADQKRFYLDPAPRLHGWNLLVDIHGDLRKTGRVVANWIVRQAR